jgi:hypothetical protein
VVHQGEWLIRCKGHLLRRGRLYAPPPVRATPCCQGR